MIVNADQGTESITTNCEKYDAKIVVQIKEFEFPVKSVKLEITIGGVNTTSPETNENGYVHFVITKCEEEKDYDLKFKIGQYAIEDKIKIEKNKETVHTKTILIKHEYYFSRAIKGKIESGYPELDYNSDITDAPGKWKRTKGISKSSPAFGVTNGKSAFILFKTSLEPIGKIYAKVEGQSSSLEVSAAELSFKKLASSGTDEETEEYTLTIRNDVYTLERESEVTLNEYGAKIAVKGKEADSDIETPGDNYIQLCLNSLDGKAIKGACAEPHVFKELSIDAVIYLLKLSQSEDQLKIPNRTDYNEGELGEMVYKKAVKKYEKQKRELTPIKALYPLKVGSLDVDIEKIKNIVNAIWETAGIKINFKNNVNIEIEGCKEEGLVIDQSSDTEEPSFKNKIVANNFRAETCNIYFVPYFRGAFGKCDCRKMISESGSLSEKHEKSYIFVGTNGQGKSMSSEEHTPRKADNAQELNNFIAIDLAHEIGHFLSLPHIEFKDTRDAHLIADVFSRKRLLHPESPMQNTTKKEIEAIGSGGVKGKAIRGSLLTLIPKKESSNAVYSEVKAARDALRAKIIF